jgi:hypothetical protein
MSQGQTFQTFQTIEGRIASDFDYHPPSTDVVRGQHEQVRASLKSAAMFLAKMTPAGREQSLALTKLEEAMFWANAAIARNQLTRRV